MFTHTMFLLLAKITVNIKMGDSCFRIVQSVPFITFPSLKVITHALTHVVAVI